MKKSYLCFILSSETLCIVLFGMLQILRFLPIVIPIPPFLRCILHSSQNLNRLCRKYILGLCLVFSCLLNNPLLFFLIFYFMQSNKDRFDRERREGAVWELNIGCAEGVEPQCLRIKECIRIRFELGCLAGV